MPISFAWDDDAKTAIRLDYTGKWTWDEFHKAMHEAGELACGSPHPISIINDVSQTDTLPDGALTQFRSVTRQAPVASEDGIVVIVGANMFAESVIQTFRKVYSKAALNWHFARTLDEARALVVRWNDDYARRVAG